MWLRENRTSTMPILQALVHFELKPVGLTKESMHAEGSRRTTRKCERRMRKLSQRPSKPFPREESPTLLLQRPPLHGPLPQAPRILCREIDGGCWQSGCRRTRQTRVLDYAQELQSAILQGLPDKDSLEEATMEKRRKPRWDRVSSTSATIHHHFQLPTQRLGQR